MIFWHKRIGRARLNLAGQYQTMPPSRASECRDQPNVQQATGRHLSRGDRGPASHGQGMLARPIASTICPCRFGLRSLCEPEMASISPTPRRAIC